MLTTAEMWALPEGWAWVRLGELGTWTGGGTPSKGNPEFWEDGTIPWVSPKDMKVHVIGETGDKITEAALGASAARLVPPGSVLMVMRSGILRHSFPVAVTDRTVTLNQDLRALTPHEWVLPEYLARFLSRASHAILDACSKDGTTVNSIDAKGLAALPVPIAPLAEQRRIVTRIDELFAEIAAGEAALTEAQNGLEVCRRSLLKAAVTGELTSDWRAGRAVNASAKDYVQELWRERQGRSSKPPKRVTEPTRFTAAVPDGWVLVSLSDLAWASSYGSSIKCLPDGTGVGVLRIPNIRNGGVSYEGLKYATREVGLSPDQLVGPGDLLIVRTNGSRALIGRGGLVADDSPRELYFASYLIRFRLVGDRDLWQWLRTYLESPLCRQWIMGQIASSAGQYNVSQTSLASMPVPIPPPEEMLAINARVAESLTAAEETGAQMDGEAADGARLRQSILRAAFEGRLAPQDPTDEPASELLAQFKQERTPRPRRQRRSKVTA